MDKNEKNLPVLYTIPKWKMKLTVPGKKRKLYFIPELNKYVDTTHVSYYLPNIGKTPQEWYDRWMLDITVPSDRPKIPDGRTARFRDLYFGYAKTQAETIVLTFEEWLSEWNKARNRAAKNSSKGQVKRYENPEERENMSRVMKAALKSDEVRKRISECTKAGFTDNVRKKLSNSLLKFYSDQYRKDELLIRRSQTRIINDIRSSISGNPRVRKWGNRRRVFSFWEDRDINLDSSYELQFFEICESNNFLINDLKRLIKYVKIFYIDPYLGDIHRYFPDFLLDDHYLIEIKPSSLLDDPINIAKFNAADLYCRENGLEYVILTEDYLFNNGDPFYGSMPF